jgi:ferrous iron transport protein B
VALNLVEEAARKGIHVNTTTLSTQLRVPVVAINARTGKGLEQLMGAVDELAGHPSTSHAATEPTQGNDIDESFLERCHRNADAVAERVVVRRPPVAPDWGSRLDEIATSRRWGFPLMLLLLAGVIWLTIVGANIPSRMLAGMFFWGESQLTALCGWVGAPDWLHGFLVLGVYRGLGWVVSVMLPPMAIFFPLFMLLEDFGYLPRVAFNLDRIFKKAGTHGKQSLTMSMGFGCNAAGVIACRILDSPRDRMIATVTNNFIPCNGRFPTLIVLATIFIGSAVSPSSSTLVAALAIVGTVLLGVGVTFAVSWALSRTLLRGVPSIFTLELPPYRIPLVGQVLLRSLVDRTWFVLKRAMVVAAPAGGITWLLGNVTLGDNTLLASVSSGLDPVGRTLGLDGFILLAFLLSLPANEILLPVLLMSYASAGSLVEVGGVEGIRQVLVVEQGWTWVTGLSVMLFSLLHYPCGTTLWTIYRETRSAGWTAFSALMPLGVAFMFCFVLAQAARLMGQGW